MADNHRITCKEEEYRGGKSRKGLSSFSMIVIFVCLFLLGLTVVPRLSVKLNPSRNHPVVNVSFSMYGQSARVIEMEVTSKLEAMFSRVKGVEQVSSYSSNGTGSVTVTLSKHVEPEVARFEISSIVRQTWPSLPPGVSYPSIRMSGTTQEASYPFLRYTINAPISPIEIQEYVENHIRTRLSEIKGIDHIAVNGAGTMIHKLEYDYRQLQYYNVSVNDIKTAISSYLDKEFLGIGKIEEEDSGEQWVRIALVPEKEEQAFIPADIQVKNSEGTLVSLDQIVRTTFEEEEVSSYFRINGLNSIYLSVTAEATANQLHLSTQIQQAIKQIEGILPAGYEIHLSYDASEYIKTEMEKIHFRSGLTVFILLCFVLLIYRNLKYSFLILFSLLANISIVAIFYYLLKVELQIFSLAGLTISLTLIIDNTIIMSDQIIQRGNKKAFLAILTATATTMGALVIIFFLDETIRLNLLDFAYVIIINLVVSLFIALFLVPALIEKLHISKNKRVRKKKGHKTIGKRFRFLRKISRKRVLLIFNRVYEWLIVAMFRRRAWFIGILILAFGIPVFLLPEKIEKKQRGDILLY